MKRRQLRDWDSMALILVDAQIDFYTDHVEREFPDYEKNSVRLLNECRESGLEVIHLRSRFGAEDAVFLPFPTRRDRIPCREGTTGEHPLQWADALGSEKIFYKQSWDGFQNPELAWYLEAREVRIIFFAGLISTMCVFLTAAGAAQRGYVSILVADCCAALTLSRQESMISEYKGLVFETVEAAHLTEQYPRWRQMMGLLDGS